MFACFKLTSPCCLHQFISTRENCWIKVSSANRSACLARGLQADSLCILWLPMAIQPPSNPPILERSCCTKIGRSRPASSGSGAAP